MASAQVKSCVLLATLFADGETRVHELQPTRDHTERLLTAMGVPVDVDGLTITLAGSGTHGPELHAQNFEIPGDFSSCCFWLAAAAMAPGNSVLIESVGLNPRRTGFLDVLRRMGADVTIESDSNAQGEPVGTVRVEGGGLEGTEVGGDEIGSLIDELPLVAVLAACARGKTVIRDADELRKKESDRIDAVSRNLEAMGVDVAERPDGLVIHHADRLRGGVEIDSRGDHRIAMAFTVLALLAEAEISIRDIECIQTSYPEFWDHFEQLTGDAALSAGSEV
jgi:3-phosphoshikimate 1-carboxyvinyltransferase